MSQKVHVNFPSYLLHKASQLSSINHKLCSLQIFEIASILNGLPSVCAMKIALVLSVIANLSCSISTSYVPNSTSTNTGIKPF